MGMHNCESTCLVFETHAINQLEIWEKISNSKLCKAQFEISRVHKIDLQVQGW